MAESNLYSLSDFQVFIAEDLKTYANYKNEDPLFHPIHYLLQIGGKRMRPALVLLANQMLNGNPTQARPVALAVEVFHNFTLMHDDIMDQAPLRRGHQTVHQKWDTNTAILSGDAMMIESYRILSQAPSQHLHALLQTFNEVALGVCKGQELDMSFETRDTVLRDDYVEMIRLKTAILLGGALQMGGILAGADTTTQEHLYKIGEELGLAFQLRDDYLDAFGDPEKFGKLVGGDIISDKKTYLRILLNERMSSEEKVLADSGFENDEKKVEVIKSLMVQHGIDNEAIQIAQTYIDSAIQHLDSISAPENLKSELRNIILELAKRES
jgi:geranylgeranyl diphosphate synthase type II